jgi:glycosyltransferase involved in cell wall biosynthesis
MIADYPPAGASPVGGPQVGTVRLVSALARHGADVIVVAPTPEDPPAEPLQLAERLTLVSVPGDDRWSLLRGLGPWRRRVQSVVEASDADLVHGQGLIPGGIAAADARQLPRIVTARGNVQADTVAAYSGLGRLSRVQLRNRLARIAVDRADAVVGVNPDWTVNLPHRPRRFVYIPNIIDERLFELRRTAEPGLVLFAGGARAIKGWPLLAAAWPLVREAAPEARLLVAGWPPDIPPPDVGRAHNDSIAVEGWLSSDELADRMLTASVLVIPSQFEVSPIVLAEAWALGLPVVATPVGGLRALAEGAAVVIPRSEPALLAAAIAQVLAGGEGIERVVEEGRRRAELHRADAVAGAHLALYTELIQDGR